MISHDNKAKDKKVAIYIRISRMEQQHNDYLDSKKSRLTSYVENQLSTNKYKFFEDIGFSSLKTHRPQFERMMECIRKDEFSHLVVYNITRLSLSARHLINIIDELEKHNIILISLQDHINTTNLTEYITLKSTLKSIMVTINPNI